MMGFENNLTKIMEKYYEEYKKPLAYLDPRNTSKTSNINLLNEQNQTVNFYNAVRNCYEDAVAWFELSIGTNQPKSGGKASTNAIDGIIYIPEEDALLIIEAKGLRKESKFTAILNDFNRTIGINRTSSTNDYKIQMKKPEYVYAITLADIWGDKLGKNTDVWDIDFKKSNLSSRSKCEVNYNNYKKAINKKDFWFSSDAFNIGNNQYRLLAMVHKMSAKEVDTYTFN